MEFDQFNQAEEIKLLNLDNLQTIPAGFPNSRPKSSLAISELGLKEMSLLSSVYDTNRRHFSASFVFDQIKAENQLNNSFFTNNIYPETEKMSKSKFPTIILHNSPADPQETKINIDDSHLSKTLEYLENLNIDGINLLSLLLNIMNLDELKLLIEMENGIVPERDGILFPDSDSRIKDLAFTWSAFRNLPHLLPKLEASGANIHNVYFHGTNAVMSACFSGSIDSLKFLIDRNADLNYINPLENRSCLHATVAGNSYEAAKFILDHGANLHNPKISGTNPILHYAIKNKADSLLELFLERGADPTLKNCLGETPLHIACSTYSENCCKILLQNPKVDVNATDAMGRTPLHYATMSAWCDLKLLTKLISHGAFVNPVDNSGFSPLHIASLNEKSKCSEMLILNGADVSCRTSNGVSALNIILRKIPESFEVFRTKLDSSIKLKRPGCQNREIEMSLDFETLLPIGDKPEASVINTFIVENRKDLLSHPLVMAFLYLKWKKIRRFYLCNILLYALAIIFMTLYVLKALAFKCYNHSNEHFICSHFSKRVIEFDWYMWLTLTCFTLPRKILSFFMNRCIKQYLWSLDNILDFVVVTSVFITSFIYTGEIYDWQSYFGAFAIISAWANLMLMIGQLPTFGTYVAMFTHIQFEFAKLLFAYSGLLIGFTLSFCVIFTREPSFRNPLTGLIKILAMMAGELDFEGLINQAHLRDNYSNEAFHPLSVCAQILFSLFIIFIAVILMNLLVGIAVHDIQGLRKHAGVTKLVRQTKLILYTEMVQCKITIPAFIEKWMPKHEMRTLKHILVVKPLNPMEKDLPKDILKAALEIAQKSNPKIVEDKKSRYKEVSCTQDGIEDNLQSSLDTRVEKLSLQMKTVVDEIHDVKSQFQDLKQILDTIVLKLS